MIASGPDSSPLVVEPPSAISGHAPAPSRLYALLGFMVFVWSINFVIAKKALEQFPPLLLGSLRFTFAGAIVLPIYIWRRRSRRLSSLEPGEARKLLLFGLVGVGINQLTFLLGLAHTSVAHAAILIAVTPMMVLFLSAWIGHEQISSRKLVGLAVAIAGVAVLQGRSIAGSQGGALGDFFILVAALSFAIFSVAGKSLRSGYDGLTVSVYSYVGSAVVLAPLTVWLASSFDFGSVAWSGWVAVLYMSLFPSLIAYMIYYHALRYLPPTKISVLAYLQPFLATLTAVPLLGEQVTASLIMGGVLVLVGVIWTERG